MTLADWTALAVLGSLIPYALFGGADFGGGVWDLLASGPTKKEQKALIYQAIAPVWEANHVWLILALVILITGFPAVFGFIGTVLYLPLTCMLFGIVCRGTAFVLRQYQLQPWESGRGWDRLFSISSVLTPVFLGIIVGAVSHGTSEIFFDEGDYFSAWLGPFQILVGFFTLSVFAFLAAVYLTNEARDEALANAFRRRAILTHLLVAIVGGTVMLPWGSFLLRFSALPFSAFFLGSGSLVWGMCLWALMQQKDSLARIFAVAEVVLVLVGWGAAQYPYLIYPTFTIENASADETTLKALLLFLAGGSFLLFPSLYYLMRIFKK